MNEVSIIINGVRYDAVEQYEFTGCFGCDLYDIFSRNCGHCLCTALDGSIDMHKMIFKKSTKSFER